MFLYVLAVVFVIIGILLLVISFLNDACETKGAGMFFIILAAAMCLLKSYLANPAPVNDFLRSLTSR